MKSFSPRLEFGHFADALLKRIQLYVLNFGFRSALVTHAKCESSCRGASPSPSGRGWPARSASPIGRASRKGRVRAGWSETLRIPALTPPLAAPSPRGGGTRFSRFPLLQMSKRQAPLRAAICMRTLTRGVAALRPWLISQHAFGVHHLQPGGLPG